MLKGMELRACRVRAHSTFSRAKRMSASVSAFPTGASRSLAGQLVDLVLLAAKMDGSFFLVGNWLLLLLPALHHGIAKIPGADGP